MVVLQSSMSRKGVKSSDLFSLKGHEALARTWKFLIMKNNNDTRDADLSVKRPGAEIPPT